MRKLQQISDMCRDSGLVVRKGGRWTCLACHASARSLLDIAHSADCMLRQLVERAARSLSPDDPMAGDVVAETMASTPARIRARVDSAVEDLCLADTPEARMPAICRIKELCPHMNEMLLTVLAFGGVPGDKGRRVLRMMLMRQAAQVEPLLSVHDRAMALKSKYMSEVNRLIAGTAAKFTLRVQNSRRMTMPVI